MYAKRTALVAVAALALLPSSVAARPSDAAPTTPYELTAAAVVVPGGTEVSARVTSATEPPPAVLKKVQVKVWPRGDGDVVTRNFTDVPAPDGIATLELGPFHRTQRVQVRAHVKDGSEHVLEDETLVGYRSLGAVSTDHWLATEVGEKVLEVGGNAFDAAAAIVFALNVTQPHVAGIGGSSDVVLYSARDDAVYSIDGREKAPAAATADMLDGRTAAELSVNGVSVGVPGTLLAVQRMLDRWGTRSLADALQPAIGLAEHGVPVGTFLAKDTVSNDTLKAGFPPATKELFRPGGVPLAAGDLLVQPDLASTFRLIARDGVSAFYRGEIAEAIVAAQAWHTYPGGEGRLTLADLASYDVDVRAALHLDYRGVDVYSAAPSSRGGMVMLEALGLLEDQRFPLGGVDGSGNSYDFGRRHAIHAITEALRLALADQVWVGDPAFRTVPEAQLLSDAYLRARSALIQPFPTRLTPLTGRGVPPGDPTAFPVPTVTAAPGDDDGSQGHTTHFSVIDRLGNVVSFTTTMADSFGSGILVPGYGFLLNDSLRLFKLLNFEEAPRPGLRVAGNMAPTVLMRDGEPMAATGTYGATFIPSLVLNLVLDVVDYRMPLQQAVDASRFWIAQPSGAWAWNHGRRGAPSFPQEDIDALRALGPPRPPIPRPTIEEPFGSLASVGVDPTTLDLIGVSDDVRQPDARAVVVEGAAG
jgi:gamma-glutamyltranspeptidase/glutathione hydrolase